MEISEKEVLVRMIDFCEENWAAFVLRCTEAGIDESHVEESIDKLKEYPGNSAA